MNAPPSTNRANHSIRARRTYGTLHEERCLEMSVRHNERPILHTTDAIIRCVGRTYKALSNEQSLAMSALLVLVLIRMFFF